MKSLTRMIIVLVVINLTIGNFALAQNASNEVNAEPVAPVAPSRVRMPVTPKPIQPLSAPPVQIPVEPTPPTELGPGEMNISGRIGLSGSKVITGLSGVEIQGLPGNPVTDENGFYTATVPYGWNGTISPTKKGYRFEPRSRVYRNITKNLKAFYTAIWNGPAPMFARTGSRKVLVIPATDVKAEDLTAITEDLQVMSHIFDERFKEPQEIQGVFVDFGDIFGRDSRSTEAIYIQNYGVLFLMEVNFAFSAPPEPQEQEVQETEEYIDPDWQRAKQKLFSPQGFGGASVPEEQYSAQQIKQIKTELIRTLKHTANIRNLQPDEWIILTVIGKARQIPELPDYMRGGGMGRSSYGSSGRSRGGMSSGMMGGGMGGGVMMGGGMDSRMGGGMDSRMGGMGGQAFGGGVMMGGGMGGMAGGGMGGGGFGGGVMMGGMAYGEMGSPSTTVLTIRAKKLHVDAFASGDLDFERFQQKVEIFTY